MDMKLINEPLISLKEAENLIFKKIIVLPEDRISEKTIRSKNLSVKLNINKKCAFFHDNNLIVLSSLVNEFEIPVADENLFRNHYKVPEGIISTTKVIVRDPKNIQLELWGNDPQINYKNSEFCFLRNSLLSAFLFSIGNSSHFLAFKESLKFLRDNDILYNSLEPHFSNGDFIKIEMPNNYSIGLERLSGTLVSFMKAVANSNNNLDKESIKDWGKKIITSKPESSNDFLDKLQICNSSFPVDWESYKSFIYVLLYFAYAKEEILNSKIFFTDNLIEKMQLNRDEVLFWEKFFKGFFSERINNIYLIQSLKEWQFNIELIAFCKANRVPVQDYIDFCFNDIIAETLPFDFQNLSEENKDIIANEYFAMASMRAKSSIERISDLKSLWPDDVKKTKKNILYSKPLLISFCNNFKTSKEFNNVLINFPENSKSKAVVFINSIDFSKEDIFSLEFRQKEKDFISNLERHTDKKIIVLNTNSSQINQNDLTRNLKKIFEDNSIKSTKNIFVYNSIDNQELTKVVISAIPNTIFWDDKKLYYFLFT